MVTQEQKTDTEERAKVSASEQELLDAAASEDNDKDAVSNSPETSDETKESEGKDAEGAEKPLYVFKTKDELLAHPEVLRFQNSANDAKAKNRDLEVKVKTLTDQLEKRQDDADLAILGGKFGEENEEAATAQYKDAMHRFQVKYREYKENDAKAKRALADIEPRERNIWAREQAAEIIALNPAAPRDKIVSELQEATTEKERISLLRALKAEYGLKTPVEDKKKTHPPNPSRANTPGGGGKLTHEKIKNMSPGEKIRRAKEIEDFYSRTL